MKIECDRDYRDVLTVLGWFSQTPKEWQDPTRVSDPIVFDRLRALADVYCRRENPGVYEHGVLRRIVEANAGNGHGGETVAEIIATERLDAWFARNRR